MGELWDISTPIKSIQIRCLKTSIAFNNGEILKNQYIFFTRELSDYHYGVRGKFHLTLPYTLHYEKNLLLHDIMYRFMISEIGRYNDRNREIGGRDIGCQVNIKNN